MFWRVFQVKAPTKFNLTSNNSAQAHGRTMDAYVAEHQDKSRNALSKALEASFVAWVEELKADQLQFSSEKILIPRLLLVHVFFFPPKLMENKKMGLEYGIIFHWTS